MDNDSSLHIEWSCIKNIFNLANKNLTNDLFEKKLLSTTKYHNMYFHFYNTICLIREVSFICENKIKILF